MRLLESHFPLANLWGCTPACGMLMTGQPKVAVWRLTGPKHLSPLPTGNSMPMQTELVLIRGPQTLKMKTRHGVHKGLIQLGETEFDGCKTSTWSTTTATTSNGFQVAVLLNARAPDSSKLRHVGLFILILSMISHVKHSLFFDSLYTTQIATMNMFKIRIYTICASECHSIFVCLHDLQ